MLDIKTIQQFRLTWLRLIRHPESDSPWAKGQGKTAFYQEETLSRQEMVWGLKEDIDLKPRGSATVEQK